MSEISKRYDRLAGQFGAIVAGVPSESWSNPSPDAGWTARDVVRHMVDNHHRFLDLVGRELGDVPSVDNDPSAAFEAARTIVKADLEDPARAGEEFDGLGGKTTFERAIDQFLNFDLVVHRWDLARATGQDETLDPEDIARVREQAEAFGDMLRGKGVCGPEIEPPAGADDQTRLLAYLGRQV